MQLEVFTTDWIGENCYILSENGHAVMVDPGGREEEITHYLEENRLSLEMILLTHGHADHILALDYFRQKTGAPVYAHREEAPILADPTANWSEKLFRKTISEKADVTVDENTQLTWAGHPIKIWHTPGHSAGSICIEIGPYLFTGDTLFKESVGRTDLPTGSMKKILHSIQKLMALPDECIVLPGHGPASTIGHERQANTFITRFEKK